MSYLKSLGTVAHRITFYLNIKTLEILVKVPL